MAQATDATVVPPDRPASTTSPSPARRRAFDLGGQALAVLSLGTSLAVAMWSVDRSLDLSDESFYLQSFSDAETYPPGVTQFHTLVDAVLGRFELGVVGYRIAGVALTVAAAVALVGAVRSRLSRLDGPVSVVLPAVVVLSSVAVLGSLQGPAHMTLTLSYNSISGSAAVVATACALVACGSSGRGRWLATAGAGLALAVLFYTKWPAAVATGGLIVVAAAVADGGRTALRWGPQLGATFVGWLAILAAGPFSLTGIARETSGAIAVDHDPVEVLTEQTREVIGAGVDALTIDAPRTLALVVLLLGPRLGVVVPALGRRAHAAAGLQILAFAYLVLEVGWAGYRSYIGAARLVASLLVAAAIVATLLLVRGAVERRMLRPLAGIVGLLLLLPAASAMGSNGNIMRIGLFAGAAWVLAAMVLAGLATPASDQSLARQAQTLSFGLYAVLATVAIVHGIVFDGFKLETDRREATELVSGLPGVEGIRFDPTTAAFLDELRSAVGDTSYQEGDIVIVGSKLPGLAYLIGGHVPGSSWVDDSSEGHRETCRQLGLQPEVTAEASLVMLTHEVTPELDECFRQLLPGYPSAFTEVATIELTPFWQGRNGGPVRVFELR